MVFPKSNLPSASQPWGREAQKRIEVLESLVATDRINNAARDQQLAKAYDRLNATVIGVAQAAADAQSAADAAADAAAAAATAAATANSAATSAANAAALATTAANTANSSIAILESLTSFVYYPGTGQSWTSTPPSGDTINYTGTTSISIPEAGGQRDVIVTAVFDVDLQTATGLASGIARQNATAYLNSGVNSTSSGGNRGTNTSNISVYGGGSLSVSGKYTVTSTSDLSWNPRLVVTSTGTGTFNGSAILRFVTVTITKV